MICSPSRLHRLMHTTNHQLASVRVISQLLVPRSSRIISILTPHATSIPVPTSITGVRLLATAAEEPGAIKKILRKMGWLEHSRSRLKASGFKMYESIAEKIEGDDGRFTRNALVEALWEDVDTRSRKLGAASLTIRKDQINHLVQEFQAALFAYDEGILSSDKVLAAALWRRLFNMECSDPERLECCVNYVRKHIALLDSCSREEILLKPDVPWEPLLERDYKLSWQ